MLHKSLAVAGLSSVALVTCLLLVGATSSAPPQKFWGTGGNEIDDGVDFLGTTDAQALVVKTDDVERMRVTPFGNVGIGTTTPDTPLEVVGGANTELLRLEGTGASRMSMFLGDSTATINSDANIQLQTTGTGTLFLSTSTQERMRITPGGDVGIGTISPAHPLEMGSGAHVTAGGVWTDASSRDVKENIRDLTLKEAAAALGELRPTRFNYKADREEEHVGFIAEDVPEIVATRDRKGLSPMEIVAVLTRVVQEQEERIARLEARLELQAAEGGAGSCSGTTR
jgi:hypothetical protein